MEWRIASNAGKKTRKKRKYEFNWSKAEEEEEEDAKGGSGWAYTCRDAGLTVGCNTKENEKTGLKREEEEEEKEATECEVNAFSIHNQKSSLTNDERTKSMAKNVKMSGKM